MSKFNLGDEVYYIQPYFNRVDDINILHDEIKHMKISPDDDKTILYYFFDDYESPVFEDYELFKTKNELIESWITSFNNLRD